MTGPSAAVQAVRLGVRRALVLIDSEEGPWSPEAPDLVMVACSGGADSLALLSATLFEAHRVGSSVVGVVVDHGLQDGSSEHTARVVAQMAAMGVDQTASIRVRVDSREHGPEGGARIARYAALEELADRMKAGMVLLGHTLDDQAETVLLGLTRGSGGRSLTGMRAMWDVAFRERDEVFNRTSETTAVGGSIPGHLVYFIRPLLHVTRQQTEEACHSEGIEFWSDPHNADPRFLRSRIRHAVMPVLERELGPGIARALARTGEMLRSDMDALDDGAEAVVDEARVDGGFRTAVIERKDPALRTRALRLAALAAGVPASELTREHVLRLEAVVLGDGGGRVVELPGHLTAYQDGDFVLRFRRTGG